MEQNIMVDDLPLPEELIELILMKLPLRDLSSCFCVCKSWSNIIKNPSFQARHPQLTKEFLYLFGLHRMKSRSPSRQPDEVHEDYDLHYNNGLHKYKHFHFPLQSTVDEFRIVGTVNGVVCLVGNWSLNIDSCYLWNPTTERVITLPKPINSCLGILETDIKSIFSGFGYDSTADDYKVVRTVKHPPIDSSTTRVEFFSLNTGSWTNLAEFKPPEHYNHICLQAFVNGVVYWIVFNKGIEIDYNYNYVLGFNVRDETLLEMTLPDSLAGVKPTTLVLLEHLGSSIAVFHFSSNQCSLWVLKDYKDKRSWRKLSVMVEADFLFCHRPLAIRSNGEILLHLLREGIISYGLKSGKSEVLINFDQELSSVFIHPFVETLALLSKGIYVPQPRPKNCRICESG